MNIKNIGALLSVVLVAACTSVPNEKHVASVQSLQNIEPAAGNSVVPLTTDEARKATY